MLSFVEKVDAHRARYRCGCGAETIAFTSNVNRGHTSSCGCLRRELNRTRPITHGHKAGGKRSKAYVVWVNMKSRCQNPRVKSYADYGARGIAVCERWQSFENFLADMGEPPPRMTLERKDNNAGYSKGNCCWAPRDEQALNKRNNVRYEVNGESKTLSEWSRIMGIGRVTMLKRIQAGVSPAVAITTTGNMRWAGTG